MTREQFEAALDCGTLYVKGLHSEGSRWYKVRRNGRTKLWKREPDRFEIPIKYKFKECMRVRDTADSWFTVVPYPNCHLPGICQGYCRRDPNCGD